MSLFFPVETIIEWVGIGIKVVVGGLVGYIFLDKKKDKEKLDKHAEDIIKLQSAAVTEDKVRQIITDSIHPLREDMGEVLKVVHQTNAATKDLSDRLARQEGYQEAMKELRAVGK